VIRTAAGGSAAQETTWLESWTEVSLWSELSLLSFSESSMLWSELSLLSL
jgi:hypothetical protein